LYLLITTTDSYATTKKEVKPEPIRAITRPSCAIVIYGIGENSLVTEAGSADKKQLGSEIKRKGGGRFQENPFCLQTTMCFLYEL
jgi:hypothetical protein